MRIAIDARMMGPENTRGIGRYIEELVRAMVKITPQHRYVLLVRDPRKSPFIGHASVEHVKADVPWYSVAEQLKMPGIIAAAKADLLHVPHWNVSLLSLMPCVVTVHDLILLSEPKSANVSTRHPIVAMIKRIGHRVVLRSALKRSRYILVPTQWVADDIHRHFPRLKTIIEVTGEGIPDPDPSVWSDPDPTNPYLLHVGSAYPHKNLDLLLDAWKILSDTHPTLSLVLAGERDAFMKRLEERVVREKLPRVQFPGRISDADLPALYAKASTFVFPSQNEGFGLPPLEAMAYGCPVVSSDATCLPEVLGQEGVFFFQPRGTDGIIRAVETVLRDPVGARNAARQAAVVLRARHDWKKTAERTLQAYETTYAQAASRPS